MDWQKKEYLQQLDDTDKEEEKNGINPLSVKQEEVKSLLQKLQEKKDKYEPGC